MVTQTITLSMIPGVTTPRIYASQFDTGLRVFEFNLVDDGGNFSIPTGATVLMNAQKQDGTIISQTCTWVGSKVTADCTTQLSSLAGCVMCEIRVVTTGSTVAGSANFVLYVEPSPIDSGIVSESDINDITELVDEATEAALTAKSFVEDWLEENITQETGYVLDTSLTVSNAAADAKVAGDWIRASFITDTASGSVASFPDGADGVPVKDLKVSIVASQSGSGDPAPDNVRPITGWSEAKVTKCGKNILGYRSTIPSSSTASGVTYTVNADKSITLNNTATSTNGLSLTNTSQSLFKPNTTYYFRLFGANVIDTSSVTLQLYVDNVSKFASQGTSFTFPASFSEAYVRIRVSSGTVTSNLTVYPMIVEGSTAPTAYEQYNGTTYTVSFGSAGTVYGGTLDVTTGVLTVTHGYYEFSASTTYTPQQTSGGIWFIQTPTLSGIVNSSTELVSNQYKTVVTSGSAVVDKCIRSIGNHVNVYDNSFTSAATVETILTANPIQIVYPLDTPQTFALTPTQVTSLLGNNNIFADCGASDVTYRADPRLYLEKLTNPDSDMTADANIASGSYFMVGNRLYLATSAISLGASIVPGTNCTATDLASALNAINA